MAEETFDGNDRLCPYCGDKYHPESETYSEDSRVEACDGCGKIYRAYDSFSVTHYASFSVTHYATPDCGLNGEEHAWEAVALQGGRTHPFCTKCNMCMPHKLLAANVELRGGSDSERPVEPKAEQT